MGSKTFPLEEYTLILKHEYIDTDGKAHLLSEPLVVNGKISSLDGNAMIYPVNAMIHELLDRMEYEAMHKYGEWNEMKDTIYRQDAIDALCDNCDNVQAVCPHYPCKQYTAIDALSPAQPQITHCRDCKHRPKATRADEKVFYGFSVEFPDEICPCRCDDGWYNWYPEDDFYCGYAERREDG